ncbi:hypothetical protein BFX83_07590 [Komagataeibacter xylinus]|nr:hypothetical protein BFX83_07590 [Komagataeibacter xylinus]
MGAQSHQDQAIGLNEAIDQHQIRLHMAVPIVLPVACQGMVAMPYFQCRIDHQKLDNSPQIGV